MNALVTTTRGMDPDQWLDRKTVASLMGRDLDTVRRVQRENSLPTRTGPNNTTLLRLGDLIALNRIPASVLDPKISARDVADAIKARNELERLRAENALLRGKLAAGQETLDHFRAHLATQSEYIAVLRVQRAGKVA